MRNDDGTARSHRDSRPGYCKPGGGASTGGVLIGCTIRRISRIIKKVYEGNGRNISSRDHKKKRVGGAAYFGEKISSKEKQITRRTSREDSGDEKKTRPGREVGVQDVVERKRSPRPVPLTKTRSSTVVETGRFWT